MSNDANEILNEVQSGKGIPLSKAAELVPGASGHVNPCTVFRWAENGCLASDGSRVKLESVRVGGRIFTSAAAITRFLTRLTNGTTVSTPAVRTPAQRRRDHESAEKELAAAGW